MNYEQLIELVEEEANWQESFRDVKSYFPNAVKAILQVHRAFPAQFKEGKDSCAECMTMDYDVYWEDCSTIKAIIKEFTNDL